MSHQTEAAPATHAYVGRKACGCIAFAAVDDGSPSNARDIAAILRKGGRVDRVGIAEVSGLPFLRCRHEPARSAKRGR
jgi:hypothetical protein